MRFGRGTTAQALEKTRAALEAAERKVTDLMEQRDGLLLADDGLSRVQEIDAAIAVERRAAAIHNERVAALTVELERERIADLERTRAANITIADKLLEQRLDCAKQVQAALNALGETIGRLYSNRDAILKNWPVQLPRPWDSDLKTDLSKEIAWTLYSAGKVPPNGSLNVPRGLETLGIQSVVASVNNANRSIIERLKTLPIGSEAA